LSGSTAELSNAQDIDRFSSPRFAQPIVAPRLASGGDARAAVAEPTDRRPLEEALAEANRQPPVGHSHAAIEAQLKSNHVKSVILSPGPFMQKVPDQATRSGPTADSYCPSSSTCLWC
jgi:hypothetical protein